LALAHECLEESGTEEISEELLATIEDLSQQVKKTLG
jgi:hypothetical protein